MQYTTRRVSRIGISLALLAFLLPHAASAQTEQRFHTGECPTPGSAWYSVLTIHKGTTICIYGRDCSGTFYWKNLCDPALTECPCGTDSSQIRPGSTDISGRIPSESEMKDLNGTSARTVVAGRQAGSR